MRSYCIDKDFEVFNRKDSNNNGHSYIPVEYEAFVFSGGEVHIKFKENPAVRSNSVRINCRIRSSNDLMRLALAVDALRSGGIDYIEAFIPYIPYARQDRRMADGEPLSIKVFASILNSLKLNEVICYDAHSDVTTALIDNVRHYDNSLEVRMFMATYLPNNGRDVIMVSPDGGAYKKIYKLCERIGHKGGIVNGVKVRDLDTGKIISTDIIGDVSGRNCLIVDDICDGGRTFIELAKALKDKGAKELYLFVSHGIFSKGITELSEYFNAIGTTNSFQESYKDFNPFNSLEVKVIKLQY